MVGKVNDISKVVTQGWKNVDDEIWLLGIPLESNSQFDSRVTLSASSYLEYIHELISGRPPEIDLKLEKLVQNFLINNIQNGFINSAHDVSDGGISIALAECCISSGLGANCQIPSSPHRLDRLLFAEGGARIIVSIKHDRIPEWLSLLDEMTIREKIPASMIGKVVSETNLKISQNNEVIVNIPINKLKDTFYEAIPRRII